MRGKLSLMRAVISKPGLIPAHAGKTHNLCCARIVGRAHPRACGENSRSPLRADDSAGSSPRMRGKLKVCSRAFSWPGLIPAHAGKTFLPTTHFRGQGAHPRACGENFAGSITDVSLEGSSPRMRGKLCARRRSYALHRLIPAHAGKTRGDRSREDTGSAHPRACGENQQEKHKL